MTVVWKSQEENERENGKGVYFDGCHRNNQELTGIVSPSPLQKKNLPFVKPNIFTTFPCFFTGYNFK